MSGAKKVEAAVVTPSPSDNSDAAPQQQQQQQQPQVPTAASSGGHITTKPSHDDDEDDDGDEAEADSYAGLRGDMEQGFFGSQQSRFHIDKANRSKEIHLKGVFLAFRQGDDLLDDAELILCALLL